MPKRKIFVVCLLSFVLLSLLTVGILAAASGCVPETSCPVIENPDDFRIDPKIPF